MQGNMVVAGRAMTVLEADALETVSEGQNPIMRQSFGLMLEALDDLKKNEVYICTGSSPTYALVGGADVYENEDTGCGRRCCKWISPRHQRNPGPGFPVLFLWEICPGPGPQRKGD